MNTSQNEPKSGPANEGPKETGQQPLLEDELPQLDLGDLLPDGEPQSGNNDGENDSGSNDGGDEGPVKDLTDKLLPKDEQGDGPVQNLTDGLTGLLGGLLGGGN